MARKQSGSAINDPAAKSASHSTAQRLPAEVRYADELAALAASDDGPRPAGWRLTPRSVRSFIIGGEAGETPISRKLYGHEVAVERSIATLVGQRGLLLTGEPGTAKSMLSELLAAAISGTSLHTVQGGAGVMEEQIRYSWNYALLLKEGPGLESLVPGPLYRAMAAGEIMRFEELTRCSTEVQDSLIPILSDRLLHVPEIKQAENSVLLAAQGFSVIATANLKDRGVNEMSSALKRRFNFEVLTPISDRKQEVELVQREVKRLLDAQNIALTVTPDVTELLVTVFQELRQREAAGVQLEAMSSIMSTAEAVAVMHDAAVHSWYMQQDSHLRARHLLRHMLGSVIKDNEQDRQRLQHYLKLLDKERLEPRWREFLSGRE